MTTSPTLRASASPREITQWPVKLLGEICEVIGGGTPSKDKSAYYRGDIPWATVRDMRQDIISDTEFRITEEAVRDSATNIIPSGNVVIATRVGLGKVCLLGQDTAINQYLRGIIPRDAKTLKVLYLYWWLKSVSDVIIAEGTGATVQGVKLPFIKSLPLSLPPLPEQERIVGILDNAFDGIAKAKATAEANLQNARALFQSHLQSVFSQRGEGWVEKKLGEVIQIQNGYAFKSGEYSAAGYFLMRISNVQDGEITLSNPKYIQIDDKKLERFVLKNGDILVSLTGNIGRVGMIAEEHLPSVLNQRVARIVPKGSSIDRDFLFRFLLSSAFRERLQEAGHGAAQQNVSTKEIECVPISLPSLDIQRSIIEQFDEFASETQRLESLYQSKLDALDELKKSLLHQAFTGKV